MRKIITLVLALSAVQLLPFPRAVAQQAQDDDDYEYTKDTSRYRTPAARAKGIIAGRAREVLVALKNQDILKLSAFAHPQKGVRFSTYAYVDGSDKRLSRSELRSLARRDRRALWFTVDEAGTPMRMTTREYLRKYVYDNDYLKATRVSYNTQHKRSNTIPNVLDFYPRAIVVEYYEPNKDPNERGWDTLWLVFERAGNEWYLTGVVKDTPTI